MAIKHIIGAGIGFSPGSVKFIVTRGFATGAAGAVSPDGAAKVVAYSRSPATVVQGSRIPRIINDPMTPKIVRK